MTEQNGPYDQARAQECIAGLERLSSLTRKQKANVNTAIAFLEKIIVAIDTLQGKNRPKTAEALVKKWEDERKVEREAERAREEGTVEKAEGEEGRDVARRIRAIWGN